MMLNNSIACIVCSEKNDMSYQQDIAGYSCPTRLLNKNIV